MKTHKIVVAVTGASGAIYAKILIEKLIALNSQIQEVGLVFSKNAFDVWKLELENTNYTNYPFTLYDRTNFFAPFASGSAKFNTVIICPCSMGTLARIANGTSDDLICRAADVALKERRKLILVTRDTPLNLIHLRNMSIVTEAGAIVCPASPSFYSKPQTVEQLATTVVDRIIDLAGLEQNAFRWGGQS